MGDKDCGSDDDSLKATIPDAVEADWQRWEEPTLAIIETVASATDRKPVSLPAIENSIDSEALNKLVLDSEPERPFCVSFQYAGTEVQIDGKGKVLVSPVS